MEFKLTKLAIIFIIFIKVLFGKEQQNFFYEMNTLINKHSEHNFINVPRSITLAQIALETGYGTSYAFNNKNNLFGLTINGKPMKFNKKEESIKSYYYSLSNNENYLIFRNYLKKKNKDTNTLIKLLSTIYSEDPNYSKYIISIIEKYSLDIYD